MSTQRRDILKFSLAAAAATTLPAAQSPAQAQAVCDRIEALTGLTVWAFPKEREFFVELRLPA